MECLGVVAERAERRSRLISGLFNPVVASALLRYCTGFCLGNFYARGVGCLDRAAYARIDRAALTAWEKVNFPLESQALQDLAQLPNELRRHGDSEPEGSLWLGICGGFNRREGALPRHPQ